MKPAIDIVYPIGPGSEWQGHEELRYSIRSACKHVQGLRDIYIIGFCPAWAKGVIHIPVPDVHKHNKDANLIDKVLAACQQPALSTLFIRMSDDQYFLKPWTLSRNIKPQAHGCLVRDGITWRGNGKYHTKIERTLKVLQQHGKKTWFFDTHLPSVYDKFEFIEAMRQVDYITSPGFTINTLYHNMAGNKPNGLLLHNQWAGIKEKLTLAEIADKCQGKQYLNNTPGGLSDGFKQYLQEQFAEPCRFE